MGQQERVLELIDRVYATALGEPLDDTMVRTAELLGAVAAAVEVHSPDRRSLRLFEGAGLPDDGMKAYGEYYHQVCPRIRDTPLGDISYDYQFIDEAQMDRDEFYADFLRPNDLRYYALGTVLRDERGFGMVGIHRTPGQGHVGEAELQLLSLLMPHFRRALEIRLRLGEAERQTRALRAMLDRLDVGAVLLDRDGAIRFVNRAAEGFLRDGPLAVCDRKLTAREPADRNALDAQLRAVLSPADTRLADARPVLIVGRFTARPVSVLVAALPETEMAPALLDDGETATVLLFLSDGRPPADAATRLRGLSGLTPAEARLAAALLQGRTLAEHADAEGVTIHTVRSHFASARAKLGARNHAELIRRLVSLLPPVSARDEDR